MPDNARHVPLQPLPWSADEARSAIDEIVSDALTNFDEKRFWPAHPLEDGLSDGDASFYVGATGVIWALEYLRRIGATQARIDFRPVLPRLVRRLMFSEQGGNAIKIHGPARSLDPAEAPQGASSRNA